MTILDSKYYKKVIYLMIKCVPTQLEGLGVSVANVATFTLQARAVSMYYKIINQNKVYG